MSLDQFSNPDMEAACCAALLNHGAKAWRIMAPLIGPEVFYGSKRRRFVELCAAMAVAGEMPDEDPALTICDRAMGMPAPQGQDGSLLDYLGGMSGLAEMGDLFGPLAGVKAYAERLGELYRLRNVARQILDAADDLKLPGAEPLQQAGKITECARAMGATRAEEVLLPDAVGQALAEGAERAGMVVTPCRWGLEKMDLHVPLMPGRLLYLAAKPGGGKTTLAIQTARETAASETDVAFLSLEMRPEDIAARLVASTAGVPVEHVLSGRLDPSMIEDARQSIIERVTFHRASDRRVDRLLSTIRDFAGRRFPLVVIDYIQLATGHEGEKEYSDLSRLSHGLQAIAKDEGICILALSQLTREGKADTRDRQGRITGSREPGLADLKGCGDLENDASAILFLVPDGDQAANHYPVDVKIAKNRFGRVGRVATEFNAAGGCFTPAAEPTHDDEQPVASAREHVQRSGQRHQAYPKSHPDRPLELRGAADEDGKAAAGGAKRPQDLFAATAEEDMFG